MRWPPQVYEIRYRDEYRRKYLHHHTCSECINNATTNTLGENQVQLIFVSETIPRTENEPFITPAVIKL